MDPSSPIELAALVRRERRAVLSTVSPDGAPEAALVGLAALDDGTLILNAAETARKIGNIRHEPRVALVIGTGDEFSVQVEGVAEVAAGSERLRLGDAYDAQYPGSRSLHDGFAVVVVRPTWVRVYDLTRDPHADEARWPLR